jgi:phage host-nuclease inhibitor protein Gam
MSTSAERLDDALDLDAPEEDTPGHWQITDPGSADWALRKLGKVDAEAHQVSELAEQQIAAIEAWRGAEHGRLGAQREHWETLLAIYHRARLEEDEKAKTIRLPHGTLTARKLPDGIVIEDEDALMAWLGLNEVGYIRVRRDLDRAAIKDAVLKNGEILPGVEVKPGDVRFTVTTEVTP